MKHILVFLCVLVFCSTTLFAQITYVFLDEEIIAAPVDQPSNANSNGQYPIWEINFALNLTTHFPSTLTSYLDSFWATPWETYTAKGLEANISLYPLSFAGLLIGYEFSSLVSANEEGYYSKTVLNESMFRVGLVIRILFTSPDSYELFFIKLNLGGYFDSVFYHENLSSFFPYLADESAIGNGFFLELDLCYSFGIVNFGIGVAYYSGAILFSPSNDYHIIQRLKIPLFIGIVF